MIPSVQVKCPRCGTDMVVIPPTIGQVRDPNQAPSTVKFPDVPEGAELVEADENGRFLCKNCGAEHEAPGLVA